MSQTRSRFRAPLSVVLAALGASVLIGCTGEAATPKNPAATGGSGGGGGSGGMTSYPPGTCESTPTTTQKRVVRLTDNQLVNTYAALFKEAAADMFVGEEISPANLRAFPPLATIGTKIDQQSFDLRDRAAKRAMAYVGSNLATLTTCGATPSDPACGLAAVLKFAETASRRPLSQEETASYQMLWTELTATNGGSVAEAIQYGYAAVLESPGFLYRTEVGTDWNSPGPLTAYELASELSYFLTDGPPDPELLAAAASNQLTDPSSGKETIRAHARRLLATDAAKANIEAAMISYFQLTAVPGAVIPDGTVQGIQVTSGLKNSMLREAEEFLKHTLWQGGLGDLVTSRRTWINSQIAPVYGLTVQNPDVNVFTEVMLPEDRSGLLTLSPFLTSKSRPPDGTSVVGRGLAVNAALVCAENPPFPEGNAVVEDAIASQSEWTEKEKADFRADPVKGAVCAACHRQFDAMGLVLENYDAVGQYRTTDRKGNAIDQVWTSSTLPDSFAFDQNGDGTPDPAVVTGPANLAQALLRDEPAWGTNALTRCMALNFINYALADESQGSARASSGVPTDSCAVRAVTDAFVRSSDMSFTSLLAEIAASETLAQRTAGM
jgi:hypothetical protein